MSFLFGESGRAGRDREIRAREEMARVYNEKEREREKAREEESDGRFHGKPIQDPLAPSERYKLMHEADKRAGKRKQKQILKEINELFPNIDMEYFKLLLKVDNNLDSIDNDLGGRNIYLKINMKELTYTEYITYKLYTELDLNDFVFYGDDLNDYVFYGDDDFIKKINPQIFMSNVNLDWKLLQLAKKDTSIHIPPTPPPKAPPLPSPPKRHSPKSKSKLTDETLQETKSKLRPKGPPYPPPLPSPPKRNSPKSKLKLTGETLQETKSKLRPKAPPLPSPPKRNSPISKSKLTKKGLEESKSRLRPKGPPYPPPLPSPPKSNSQKSKSTLTKKGLEESKSKLKHIQKKLKPDNPDYDLEMAFRDLEKK
jgi:hypothetical protein